MAIRLDSEGADMQSDRRAHYASFYGAEAADGATADGAAQDGGTADGAAVVLGNCQAESLRIVLTGDDLPTVRVPPVHEMVATDLAHLDRLLERAAVVVSQPIRDDYRGLPLGTRQVAARTTARLMVVPAVRVRSLHPAQVVVRHPDREVEDPPLVPYHDLRTVARALGGHARPVDVPAVRRIGTASVAELRAREERNGAIPISDFLETPNFAQMRTVNHPGNPVWMELARRVRRALGRSDQVTDPGRPLLSSIVAPREAVVAEAWGLDDAPRSHWLVEGRPVDAETVEHAHRRWYDLHPEQLRFAAHRHAEALREFTAS